MTVISPATAGEGVAEGQPTVAEKALLALRAANDTRSALERERGEWQAERERLELLLATLKREADRFNAAAEKTAAETAKLRHESAGMVSSAEELRKLEEAAGATAGRLEEELDRRAGTYFPGVVPLGGAAAESVSGRLDAALKRLADTESACRKWSVEIVSGLLGGSELAVNLLRAGNACAWWQALDGSRAGTALMREGKLELRENRQPEQALRIAAAFAMYAGRLAPAWLVLPLELKLKTEPRADK